MPGDFGSYLKKERELRGVPLEEISKETKIRLSFLKALEENDFDSFPGEVFIKGYIRSYAKSIGSDVDEVLNIYDDEVGRERKERLKEKEEEALSASKEDSGVFKLFLSLLALLVIGAGVYFLLDNLPGNETAVELEEKKEENDSPVTEVMEAPSQDPLQENGKSPGHAEEAAISSIEEQASEPPQKEIAAEEGIPETSTEQVEGELKKEEAPAKSENKIEPVKEAEKHSLLIKSKEESWFRLQIDELEPVEFNLTAGLEKTVTGDQAFKISIGNRAGVELALDGKPLAMPKGVQNVVRDFIINPKKKE